MFYFKPAWIALALLASVALGGNVNASEGPDDVAVDSGREAYEKALEAAEAERATAMEAVERARVEMSRAGAEQVRTAAEQAQAASEMAEARRAREAELAQMRDELKQAHDELRKASREVARMHREVSRESAPRMAYFNVSERAVIGVVLGENQEDGVEIIGVSPDGPAERAGLQQADVIVGMHNRKLVDYEDSDSPRDAIYDVMSEVGDGEEIMVTVRRGDNMLEIPVIAETREPIAYQSIMRLPSAPLAPGAPRVIIERIEVPEIDHEALAAQVEDIRRQIEHRRGAAPGYAWHADGDTGEIDLQIHSISDFGGDALNETSLWFGLPVARGLELSPMNEGLGEYFNTDEGVLVVRANEDNPLQLLSGDVILNVAGTAVDKPSDFMRALRRQEAGSEFQIEIKRKKRSRTLDVVMPENRIGMFMPNFQDWTFSLHTND